MDKEKSLIKKFLKVGDKLIPVVGDPPPGKEIKFSQDGLAKFQKLKSSFVDKTKMSSDLERTETQEDVAAVIRPSGSN